MLGVQVVKQGKVQNRLVPDAPVQDWTRRIEDLQPDIDRVLQVRSAAQAACSVHHSADGSCCCCI